MGSIKCRLCDISVNNKSEPTFGYGAIPATLMFIGEAPGATEARLKIPFVGKAGILFNKCLGEINLSRNNVYTTNIIKCRPFENDTPKYNEILNCASYLVKEIQVVKPKIIVLMGSVALNMFFRKAFISRARGHLFSGIYSDTSFKDISYFPIYHPSFILRNQSLLPEYKSDFKKIQYFYKQINPI